MSTSFPADRSRRLLAVALGVTLAACGEDSISHDVEITTFAFEPAVLEVSPGDSIRWTNRDFLPHTVSDLGGAWDSGPIEPGESWLLVATEADSLPYLCSYHPSMKGSVVVRRSSRGE